jgi:hypothetical protein
MRNQLEKLPGDAFEWFLKELAAAPFCHVELAGKAKGKFRYVSEGRPFDLPVKSGIYVVYPKNAEEPIYAGEGSNLGQRVKYHFSESKSANKYSTLKKKLQKKGFPPGAPSHQLVRFKHVTVPFGRKEIEQMFHAKYGINTKERRGS